MCNMCPISIGLKSQPQEREREREAILVPELHFYSWCNNLSYKNHFKYHDDIVKVIHVKEKLCLQYRKSKHTLIKEN
jgi:hypothetical protein